MTAALTPAPLLALTAWLRAVLAAVRIADTTLIPGVGVVSPDETRAALRAARPAYASEDQYGAVTAIEGVLYPGVRNSTTWDESTAFLAWFESLAR